MRRARPGAALIGCVQAVLPQAVQTFGLRRYAADLRMVDQHAEDLAARKLGYAALGVAFPTVMSLLLLAAGVRLPFAVPASARARSSVAVFFWLPDLTLRSEATAARAAMRSRDLRLPRARRHGTHSATPAPPKPSTVPQRSAGRASSPGSAMPCCAPSSPGNPPGPDCPTSPLRPGSPSWATLADIMRIAGHDGAAVYATLRARAASLRTQLLATSTAEANAASEHMVVPVSLLGLCFMALLGYPAFVRILFG